MIVERTRHGTVNRWLSSTLMSAVRDWKRTSRKVHRMKRPITTARLMTLVAIGLAGSMILFPQSVRARTAAPAVAEQSAAVTFAHLLRFSAAAFTFSAASTHIATRHSARTGVRHAMGSYGRSGTAGRLAPTLATVRTASSRYRFGTMAGRYTATGNAATGTARSCPHMTSSTSSSTGTTSTTSGK